MIGKNTKHKLVFPASILVLVLLWEFLPPWLHVPNYVFPSLSSIIERSVLSGSERLLDNTWVTLQESFWGFLIGSFVGFLIGVLMAQSRTFQHLALPYVVASNAVPVIAIAPLLVMWVGSGIWSKILVAAFLCFFPLAINAFRGLTLYPMAMKELFDLYGASSWQFLWRYKLRAALPYLLTGLKLNAVFAVIGSIVAEFVGSDRGLGFGMLQASYSLDTPRLWGYIIVACCLGMAFYGIMALLERRLHAGTEHTTS